jgi:hypothetical protein
VPILFPLPPATITTYRFISILFLLFDLSFYDQCLIRSSSESAKESR